MLLKRKKPPVWLTQVASYGISYQRASVEFLALCFSSSGGMIPRRRSPPRQQHLIERGLFEGGESRVGGHLRGRRQQVRPSLASGDGEARGLGRGRAHLAHRRAWRHRSGDRWGEGLDKLKLTRWATARSHLFTSARRLVP